MVENRAGASRVSSLIFLSVIAAAPFPFGSVDRSTISFWCVLLGIALALSFPRGLLRGHLLILFCILLVAAMYAFVLHEQLSYFPWLANYNPIWGQASAALGTDLAPTVSIVRNAPYYALGAPLASVLALACGVVVGTDRRNARTAFNVLAWSGSAYALYGIVSFGLDPTMVLWREKPSYHEALTATFINRNTAAAYFGVCSIVWSVFLWEAVRARLPRGRIRWREGLPQLLIRTPKSLLIAFSMCFLCMSAMAMTASRAGVILSLVMLALGFVLYFRRHLPSRAGIWLSVMIAVSIAILAFQFLAGSTDKRFESQGLGDTGRWETYRATLKMIADHPWFGTGLGTFRWGFPQYRSDTISTWGVWDRAHSTPLEIAAEMGVPIAIVLTISWLAVLTWLGYGLIRRRGNAALLTSALLIATLSLLHSLIDFSLQIPGFAIVACAVTGVGLAQALVAENASPSNLVDSTGRARS